ncbi:hypothetical protein AC578_4135 [Pseudocercospora eumusae]|uniref:Uncharacterized protein n=1 Tax=Pseudocercospora eumusae TaxID=321146 RepID=A0A139HF43_9PEZI|nr:hypothetical protein AC578_4135 [Pseudocercospora eumusae]
MHCDLGENGKVDNDMAATPWIVTESDMTRAAWGEPEYSRNVSISVATGVQPTESKREPKMLFACVRSQGNMRLLILVGNALPKLQASFTVIQRRTLPSSSPSLCLSSLS